ncbi:hypothetical protein JAAARDRAFT_387428 [Jaapia argillacea MUCL 33604]|uniref:Uncharacterized protein n=1 Tax=Jaapia argillacea MUCL 33604 TaxID=933084 RepID=A0A067QJI5_9AGAM|nr:hypothetical protein JAAARDRAFT_387428 [Jaapia argillacea MUCL 33604]
MERKFLRLCHMAAPMITPALARRAVAMCPSSLIYAHPPRGPERSNVHCVGLILINVQRLYTIDNDIMILPFLTCRVEMNQR